MALVECSLLGPKHCMNKAGLLLRRSALAQIYFVLFDARSLFSLGGLTQKSEPMECTGCSKSFVFWLCCDLTANVET